LVGTSKQKALKTSSTVDGVNRRRILYGGRAILTREEAVRNEARVEEHRGQTRPKQAFGLVGVLN
jgi:hypothetical protein